MSQLREDLERLVAQLAGKGEVAVLLSGGMDSSVVAAAAVSALGGRARAVTVRSEFVAGHDLEWATRIAEHLGIRHAFVAVRALDDPGIRAHERDRCYRCKKLMCRAAADVAGEALLLDGTNADDDESRPGLRALREFGVCSPLKQGGFSRTKVEALALEYALPVLHRPSNSCLATRLEWGRPIRREDLARVARMEEVLRETGFKDVRARIAGGKLTVEIPEGTERLLEAGHSRIMETAKGLGLALAGYAHRGKRDERA